MRRPMSKRIAPMAAAAAALLLPALASAQAEDDPPKEDVAVEEDRSEPFPIRRGVFFAGDFGGYFSFGGRNTNVPELPSRSVSNFQPFIAMQLGYDLMSSSSFNWGVGLRAAMGFNAGSGFPTDAQIANGDARSLPADFTLSQVGIANKFGFHVLERLAVTVNVDAGLAVIEPDLTEPVASPNAGQAALGFGFGVGPGIEFHTLFPGVSVGLDIRYLGHLVSGRFVQGLAFTAPLKYNF